IAAAAALVSGTSTGFMLTVGLLGSVDVLSLAMIVAGIRGRDSGWIGFLAFVGVVALIFAPFTSVLPQQTEVVPFGNATIFAQPAESDRAMLMLAGNATVDLEDLTRTSPARHIDVWLLRGNVTVRLADDHTARTN